ncbi:MAG: hypothetical protein JRG91_17330, partial [Deltaproteobacteria bacterium]|nr:hypothetical protein [Deltaproteobacteria bacterium]
YLHFHYGNDGDVTYNEFSIGRGYLTMKVRPVEWFEPRITLDAHQDESGDMKVRLKYLYGKFKIPVETKVVTDPFLEFGIVHMPWLDYEEHINWYRAQGTMFMERNKLFNSADFGATLGTLLGRKLDKDYQETVSSKYPGSLGSMAIGVYNGGGYHALEKNAYKSFDGRISIRPLGPVLPNLQLSYFFIVGRGNQEKGAGWKPPLWRSHAFMASFEHRYLAVTGQFVMGKGNQKGNFTHWATEPDPATGEDVIVGIDEVYEFIGASGFLEIKLPMIWSSLIGRFDWFRKDDDGSTCTDGRCDTMRAIAGYAFHFHKTHKNFVMVDVDYIIPDRDIPGVSDVWEVKLTLQIKL